MNNNCWYDLIFGTKNGWKKIGNILLYNESQLLKISDARIESKYSKHVKVSLSVYDKYWKNKANHRIMNTDYYIFIYQVITNKQHLDDSSMYFFQKTPNIYQTTKYSEP